MIQKSIKKSTFWSSVIEFAILLVLVFLIRTIGFGLYQVPTGSMETTMLVGERFFADKFTYLFKKPQHNDIIAFNDPEFIYSDNKFISLFQQYVWGPSNWTKRVIGIPGDEIRGVIEENKPTIYRNGKKINEPYLNKYPLIYIWKKNPNLIREQVEEELKKLFQTNQINETLITKIMEQKWEERTYRSYNPKLPFDKQPFYRISPELVCWKPDGKPDLLEPGVPIYAPSDTHLNNTNYWNGSDEFAIKLGPDQYWLMGDNRRGSKDSRVLGPIKGQYIHGRIIFRIWSIDSDEAWWILDLIKHPIDFWHRVRWNRFFQWMH